MNVPFVTKVLNTVEKENLSLAEIQQLKAEIENLRSAVDQLEKQAMEKESTKSRRKENRDFWGRKITK